MAARKLLVLLVLCGCASQGVKPVSKAPARKPSEMTAQELYAEARGDMAARDFPAAKAALEHYLGREAHDAAALFDAGWVDEQLGDLKSARERYAAIYDIVSPDPALAWPQTENSPRYPRYLFDDPRSRLVAPALRGSYALTGSLETDSDHGDLTGVHIILSDGGTDTVREQRAAALLKTGFFYGASRSRIIEGSPEPPEWLEVFETDLQDPLTAYARACDALESRPPADGVRQRSSRPFVLVAAH